MYIGFSLDKSMTLNMRVQRSAIVSCPDFLLLKPYSGVSFIMVSYLFFLCLVPL